MIQSDFQKIKEMAQEFFKKTSLDIEVEVKSLQENTIPIELKVEEPQVLIGEGGQTLAEIQRLLKIILKRKIITEEPFYIDIDINDYKKKKIVYLKEMARTAADEVVLTKKEKTLASMPAYERRIIHMELASRENVVTESVGQEPERKIIIKER